MASVVRSDLVSYILWAYNYGMEETRAEKDQRLRLQEKFDPRYVMREGEWTLVKLIVFGLCGLIFTGFITAFVTIVLNKL